MWFDVQKQRVAFKAAIIFLILAVLPWTKSWVQSIAGYELVAGFSVLNVVAVVAAGLLWQYHRKEI